MTYPYDFLCYAAQFPPLLVAHRAGFNENRKPTIGMDN
jgi:hypothetical protein